jgi:hypothetical protein
MGRDVFTGIKRPKGEDTTVFNLPLQWLKPKVDGSGISFGIGVSYQSGEEPIGIGTVFPVNQRICLVESSLPSVAFSIIENYDETSRLQSLSVTNVTRTAQIQVIPYPYHSTTGIIRENEICDPEIILTVLGYRDAVRGLAIAEKVTTRTAVTEDQPLQFESTHINRYPYFIPDYGTPEFNDALSPQADEYYYTEEEYTEAIAP